MILVDPRMADIVGTAIFDLDAAGATSRRQTHSFICLISAGRP